jgi:hypothetical protein
LKRGKIGELLTKLTIVNAKDSLFNKLQIFDLLSSSPARGWDGNVMMQIFPIQKFEDSAYYLFRIRMTVAIPL